MIEHNQVKSLFGLKMAESNQPVLLQAGQGDEALRYFAPATRVTSGGEYLVYVDQSSLLLDVVRLKRSVLVQADFACGSFDAELSVTNISALSGTKCALSLSLLGKRPGLDAESELCCPIT